MREKVLQFFKRITKGDGSLRSVTDAPLTDAHILSPEELADFDRTLREKSLPPLDADAAGVVFDPQDRFAGRFLIGFLAFAFLMTIPNILAFGSALFTWRSLSFDMVFKAFILPVFAAVMLAGLVKIGFYRRLWVLVEPERLRLRSRVFGRVADRIIPFHRIANIRYEYSKADCWWDGASLLLDSGEMIPLLRLGYTASAQGTTLKNNNTGFLVRALSFACGVRVSGNITEDGLGAVAGGIEIDLRHPPPEEKPFESLADELRRDLPPGNTVLTPASAGWRWRMIVLEYGMQNPSFAVRREHRRLFLSFTGFCAAVVFGVWCWQSRHAYQAWIEALLETENCDLPALFAAAKLVALPYFSLVGLWIGFFYLFGSRWIVVLKDGLDVHRSGLLLHTRLAKIPREDIAGIGMERNGEWAKLVIERKRKRNFRVPWALGEEEAVALGRALAQWSGITP